MSTPEFNCPSPTTLDAKTLAQGVKYFKDILKLDSRNPNADEEKVVAYLNRVLKGAGFSTKILRGEKKRPNLITRLKAKNPTKPALLLTGHTDTVPWSEQKWKHHPLSAKEDDGYIYGRGAIDMKNHVIYSLISLLQLKKQKVALNRDIVFAAVADEEAGCTHGSQYLVENHPKLFDGVGYALNEVGGFPVYVEGQQFYFIQTEEKGFAWFEVTFEGKAGHGSLASKESANNPLTRFVQDLFNMKIKAEPSQVTRDMIDHMADNLGGPKKFIFKLLKYPMFNDLVLKILPADKRESFYAMTHTTYAPTVIESSDKINVVPGEGRLLIDTRFVPDSSVEQVTNLLQKMLPPKGRLRLIKTGGPVANVGRNEIYDIIESEIGNDVPGVKVIPYTLIGFSDANQYQRLGIQTLGFSPVFFPPDVVFSDLFHGHNERIYRPGFEWGIDIFYRVVRRYVEEA